MKELKLSSEGKNLLSFTVKHIESILNKFNFLRTQVIYPGNNDEYFSIELAKIFDQLVNEFNLKSPFTDKKSEYFAFMKETAIKILKIKIESDSPQSYAFCYQTEDNNIVVILRDPKIFGITKLIYNININNDYTLTFKKAENLPSNAYTNPLFSLEL